MPKRNKPFPDIIRERLRAGEALVRLQEVEEELADHWTDLTPAQVAAKKLQADICRWKVDKVVPTPKAVELSGSVALDHSISVKVA